MSSTASAARIAANKANGLKSTGPRTAEGKSRVSANALKHGLRSERNPLDLATDTALPAEREEFLATLEAFKADLAPQGPIETRLVERLAHVDLRLQRAVRPETAHLENKSHETIADAAKAGSSLATDTGRTRDNWLLMFAFLRDPAALKLLGQYESRLSRDFARTLAQLRHSQKMRAQSGEVQELREQTQSHPNPTSVTNNDTAVAHPSAVARTSVCSGASASPKETPAAPNPIPSQTNPARVTLDGNGRKTTAAPFN